MSKKLQLIKVNSWRSLYVHLVVERIKEMWCVYTMEYFSIITKDLFESFLGKWLQLETVILSEIHQTQSYTLHGFPYIRNSKCK